MKLRRSRHRSLRSPLERSPSTKRRRTALRRLEPLEPRTLLSVSVLTPPGLAVDQLSLTNASGKTFFAANDGTHGWQLWATDGTNPGTIQLTDMPTDSLSNRGVDIAYDALDPVKRDLAVPWVVVGNRLFFTAADTVHGDEVWTSDGTIGGTKMLTDARLLVPYDLIAYGNLLMFVGDDVNGTKRLWRSDGTSAGTEFINTDVARNFTTALGVAGGKVVGTNCKGLGLPGDLWISDGTASGTFVVAAIGGAGTVGPSLVGNDAYYDTVDASNSYADQLWKSDGTAAGTTKLAELTGARWSLPFATGVGGGALVSATKAQGWQLWTTDGTAAGTKLIVDETGGWNDLGNVDTPATHVNGKTVFEADDGVHGDQLWVSDGTSAGTLRLTSFSHDTVPSEPFSQVGGPWQFPVLRGWLYFTAGGALWKTDGTPVGTERVSAGVTSNYLDAANGKLVFSASNGTGANVNTDGNVLVVGDGTVDHSSIVGDFGQALLLKAVNLGGTFVFATNATASFSTDPSKPGVGVELAKLDASAPSLSSQAYVKAAYHDILGQAVEFGGLASAAKQLDSGTTRYSYVTGLDHSAQYFGDVIITPAYQRFLGRAPDASGLAFWVDQMQQHGLTDERLEAGFIGSPEYYAHSGGSDKLWVDAMYQNLLGRGPDSGGEAYWVSALAQGADRAHVAYGFAASVERERQRVSGDYFHYLGRGPDQAGLDYWVHQFAQGFANEELISGFVASDEYYKTHTS